MKVLFDESALDTYNPRMGTDRKLFAKLVSLIKNIQREPFSGLGKPEPLKHALVGFWSRRITEEHRLVYKVEDDTVCIKACKGHYESP
jgi:toxin YoeB